MRCFDHIHSPLPLLIRRLPPFPAGACPARIVWQGSALEQLGTLPWGDIGRVPCLLLHACLRMPAQPAQPWLAALAAQRGHADSCASPRLPAGSPPARLLSLTSCRGAFARDSDVWQYGTSKLFNIMAAREMGRRLQA